MVSLLRGVNVGGHNKIGMAELRGLYESLGMSRPQTYVQSGNVVFETGERKLERVAERLEEGIERTFGFRPAVILRTAGELRDAVERNPFAARGGIEPSKLLVTFLRSDPGEEVREAVRRIPTGPEELRIDGREMYIYFPNGMGRPKLSLAQVERTLKVAGTGRNWNTVTKLLEMAEQLAR
jgi:uncharacterized protein (DUF1697 family)